MWCTFLGKKKKLMMTAKPRGDGKFGPDQFPLSDRCVTGSISLSGILLGSSSAGSAVKAWFGLCSCSRERWPISAAGEPASGLDER
jgi:hypothetical protein